MKKQIKIVIAYLTPAMLTLFMGIVILAVQGIWPFGANTVDFYDMGQQIAAEYIQIYDEMHASKSVFFDWYLMAGHGIPGGTYISLLNIFLYFMPRDMILEFFSVFLLIKIMLMAVAMKMCIRSEAPQCPDFYATILAAGYGLCGYVLIMYTILAWLDIAVLVPFIVTLARKVLTDGHIGAFVICTTLAFWIGFYIPAMILIFIFLSVGLYLCVQWLTSVRIENRKLIYTRPDRRIYVLRLGIGVVLSLLLSAFIWVPDLMQAQGSMRYNIDGDSNPIGRYLSIVMHVQPDYATRLWALLGFSFAAAVTFVGIIHDIRKKNKKRIALTVGNIVLVCAGLVFESIQLFWCFGSYVNYPARNGFLFYIVFALAAARYIPEVITENGEELTADKKISKVRVYSRGRMVGYEDEQKTGINIFVGIGLVVSLLLCAGGIFWYESGVNRSIYDVFKVTILCMAGAFVIYLLLILAFHGRFAKLAAFLICAELIFYGVALIGEPNYYTGYTEGAEQESEYIRISNQLKSEFDIKPSSLDRMKNPDNSLNANFGRFLERGTIAGWLPSTSSKVISSAAAMGYTTQFTRVLTSGGNVFTDALMHVTQSVSTTEEDPELYTKIASKSVRIDNKTGEKAEYSLYNTKYRLSFGTIISDKAALDGILSAAPGTDWDNAVYEAICPDEIKDSECNDFAQLITETLDQTPVNFEGDNNEIAIEGKKALYLWAGCVDADFENVEISVNGNIIAVPTIGNTHNTRFPTQFNNNCMLLGTFRDETVTVRVDTDASIEAPVYDFKLYTIDINKLSKLCGAYSKKADSLIFTAGGSSLNARVTAESSDSYLLLPIAYDNGWKAKVNGTAVKPVYVNGLMMAVPVSMGDNVVKLTYSPTYMIGLAILALIILVMCIIYEIIFERVKKTRVESRFRLMSRIWSVEKKCDPAVAQIYCAAWMLVILAIYVIPAIYGIVYYVGRFI